MNLEGLLQVFQNNLTESNYNALIGIVTTEVTTRLEKVILKSTFNRVSKLLFFFFFLINIPYYLIV